MLEFASLWAMIRAKSVVVAGMVEAFTTILEGHFGLVIRIGFREMRPGDTLTYLEVRKADGTALTPFEFVRGVQSRVSSLGVQSLQGTQGQGTSVAFFGENRGSNG